jgi:cell division protein ZipA
MDFTTKQWFVGIIVLVIVAIIIDGVRRMRKARQDSLHMSLDPKSTATQEKANNYGSEFPNGGARPSQKSIDKGRIDEVRSQYDFGRDMSTILEEAKEKLSQDPQDRDMQWLDNDESEEDDYTSEWDDEYEEPIVAHDRMDDSIVAEREPAASIDQPIETHTETHKKTRVETETLTEEHTAITADREPEYNNVTEDASPTSQQPTQTSLNLEESVPVLMDTIEEEQVADEPLVSDDADNRVISQKDTPAEDGLQSHGAAELGDDDVSIRSVGKHTKPAIEPTIEEDNLETRSANKPKYQSKYFSSNVEQEVASTITEVLVINVRATKNQQLQGSDLLEQVLANGLRYGAMNIFHRHADEDGEGPVLFSMANMLKPGTFDLKSIDHFTTVGVTFFLTLPVSDNQNMAAFETMLTTAKNVASSLGAELNDDQRSIMTAQTMEHYRERIRDFARRQQLEKNKS